LGYNNPYDPSDNNNNNDNDDGNGDYGSNNGASLSSFGFGLGASNASFDYASALQYRSIHGIVAAVAFAFLFPLGSILMRVAHLGPHTWVLHGLVQLVAYALYTAAAGLGLHLVSIVRIPSSSNNNTTSLLDMAATNAHPIIGIVLLGVLFFQPLLGLLHHRRFKRLGTRTWVSHAHLWTGRFGITLGIVNGGLGLALAGATGAPVIAYAIIAGVMWVLWLLAAGFGEYRRARAQDKEGGYANGGVPGAVVPPGLGRGFGDGEELELPRRPIMERDIPSPPYTPGPHYEAHTAGHQPYRGGEGEAHEMRNVKEVVDRPDTVSSPLSHDGMYIGQV
jgi:hypothetical protein